MNRNRPQPTRVLVWGLLPLVAGLAPAHAAGGGLCLREATGFTQPSVCVANDVLVSELRRVGGSTTCLQGDSVTVAVQAQLTCNASTRFDIGLFIDQQGTDALQGAGSVCFRDFLNPVSADNTDVDFTCASDDPGDGPDDCGPFHNAEVGTPDACGDIANANGFVDYTLNDGAPFEITCVDVATQNDPPFPDGTVDVGICVSWSGSSMNVLCSGEQDTLPPTPTSSCRCSTVSVVGLRLCGFLQHDVLWGLLSSLHADQGFRDAECVYAGAGATLLEFLGTLPDPPAGDGYYATCPSGCSDP